MSHVDTAHPQGNRPPDERAAWHSLSAEAVLACLQADRERGLSTQEVLRRLRQWGPNRLEQTAKRGPFKRFLAQFHNVLIYVLLTAAIGTGLLGEWVDTGVILGVVLINAAIGFLQEGKAEQALDAIRGMLSPKALVLRNGQRSAVDAAELVPGDIVLLQAGDRVPADLRLIVVKNLRIEEAVLTGESVAVEKAPAPVAIDAVLGERYSLAFSGTIVTYGRGVGVVVATGAHTQIGRISTMLAEVQTLTTPLVRQVRQFGRWLSGSAVVLALATFAFGLRVRGYAPVDMFMAAVSLAVAAIPEGLPAIMTITLAIGVQRMARRNAIIRRLPAVETLGAVTVICSDKTGTLTRNEMTVQSAICSEATFGISGTGYVPVGGFHIGGKEVDPEHYPVLSQMLRAALLCNEAVLYHRDERWQMEGDHTEGALLTAALKGGLAVDEERQAYPRTDVIPFESEHKFMATLHHDHQGRGYIFLKGAPERVIGMCDLQRTDSGDRPLDRARWQTECHRLASHGQRLLALAVKETHADHLELTFADVERGMVLLGVFGIIDPAREEAIDAVAKCRRAGIQVKMITGDHGVTAMAVGAQLGIGDGSRYLTGTDLEAMDDQALREAVKEIDIFARTSPEHKLRLVSALQANNHVVAMTGDGVNDAPALKRADIGVAMGRKGTEAAKEASEMVLADDNFASIAHAVVEGRTVYDNLTKAILFLLPTSMAQAFTIVAAVMLGLTLPLTPVQVLWVNMVTAVTLALALAFEPTEPGVMERPPRKPGAAILSGFLIWRIGFVSALLLAGTFGHFLWLQVNGAGEELARTAAINTLVAGQIFYLFNSRYMLGSSLTRKGLLGNRVALLASGLLIVLQLIFTYAPAMQALFGTAALEMSAWAALVAFGILMLLIIEAEKALLKRYMR